MLAGCSSLSALNLERCSNVSLVRPGCGWWSRAARRAWSHSLNLSAAPCASETLAVSISFEHVEDAEEETLDIDGHALTITLNRVVPPETS